MTLVEIALDDVAGARIAELAGADRLELCGTLDNGGTTPTIGFVEEVAATVERVGLMVLLRPRGGDFVYSAEEVRVMERDIVALRGLGTGFVLGALTPDGEVDIEAVTRLVAAAEGAPITFHRAIDSTRDLSAAAALAASLGVSRILTSGGRRTAEDGVPVIRSLVSELGGHPVVLVGGSVRPTNAAWLVDQTGAPEIHLKASMPRAHRSTSANPEQDYDAAPVGATDGEIVRAVVAALAAGAPA